MSVHSGALSGQSRSRGSFHLLRWLFAGSCLIALWCYYLIFDFKTSISVPVQGQLYFDGTVPPESLPQGPALIAFLSDYCGSFIYILPLLLVYAAYCLFWHRFRLFDTDFFRAGLRILGFNTFILGCTALLSALSHTAESGAGGILGDFLNMMISGLFGQGFSALTGFALTAVGLLLLWGGSPVYLCELTGAAVSSLFRFRRRSGKDSQPAEPVPAETQADRQQALADTVLGGKISAITAEEAEQENQARQALRQAPAQDVAASDPACAAVSGAEPVITAETEQSGLSSELPADLTAGVSADTDGMPASRPVQTPDGKINIFGPEQGRREPSFGPELNAGLPDGQQEQVQSQSTEPAPEEDIPAVPNPYLGNAFGENSALSAVAAAAPQVQREPELRADADLSGPVQEDLFEQAPADSNSGSTAAADRPGADSKVQVIPEIEPEAQGAVLQEQPAPAAAEEASPQKQAAEPAVPAQPEPDMTAQVQPAHSEPAAPSAAVTATSVAAVAAEVAPALQAEPQELPAETIAAAAAIEPAESSVQAESTAEQQNVAVAATAPAAVQDNQAEETAQPQAQVSETKPEPEPEPATVTQSITTPSTVITYHRPLAQAAAQPAQAAEPAARQKVHTHIFTGKAPLASAVQSATAAQSLPPADSSGTRIMYTQPAAEPEADGRILNFADFASAQKQTEGAEAVQPPANPEPAEQGAAVPHFEVSDKPAPAAVAAIPAPTQITEDKKAAAPAAEAKAAEPEPAPAVKPHAPLSERELRDLYPQARRGIAQPAASAAAAAPAEPAARPQERVPFGGHNPVQVAQSAPAAAHTAPAVPAAQPVSTELPAQSAAAEPAPGMAPAAATAAAVTEPAAAVPAASQDSEEQPAGSVHTIVTTAPAAASPLKTQSVFEAVDAAFQEEEDTDTDTEADAAAEEEGAAVSLQNVAEPASGHTAVPDYTLNQGHNSSTSNLPSYLQGSTAPSVAERDREEDRKPSVPLKLMCVPSSVSAPLKEYDSWRPSVELLTPSQQNEETDKSEYEKMGQRINDFLSDFKIRARVVDYQPGPVITRFALALEAGVRSAAISALEDDLCRFLMVQEHSVRVISSLPGTQYVGLEVPSPKRQLITLRDVADTEAFRNTKAELPLCLGKDVTGNPVVLDLAVAPHLLIAGTTGSGKSAGINTMLISLLLKRSPSELRLLLIDPKRIEFSLYNNLPHLITPVISDVADKTAAALSWCLDEMERRYKLIEAFNVRKLSEYNAIITKAQENGDEVIDPAWSPEMGGEPPVLKRLPYIVIVVEEFADLMAQTSGRGRKNDNSPESSINRLAAKARAAGMHIVLATQSPRSDVITGTIKANMPSRIAFTVQSALDSRIILDETGAECLLGYGDMLAKFNGKNRNASFRAHGAFLTNSDVEAVVEAWKEHGQPDFVEGVTDLPPEEDEDSKGDAMPVKRLDKLFDEAAAYTRDYYAKKQKYPPISDFQSHFGVGYPRAKKIVHQLTAEGVMEE